MRKPFIAGNWKMNLSAEKGVEFVTEIKDALDALVEHGIEVAVCPPFTSIPAVAQLLADSSVGIGAQNMHFAANGAYTGEISAEMLTPFCQYVILGHSERRAMFAETDKGVNQKARVALAHGLVPIICVGESLEQNEAGETLPFVSGQVRAAFAGMSAEEAVHCVIAYEPIWAIGTGRSADPKSAGQIIKRAVRDTLADLFGEETAQAIRIQYGGSANENNIASYMAHPDIDGALVGGASLKTSFVALVRGALGL